MEYSKNTSVEEIKNNQILLDAITFRMIQMSEHIDDISDDFKQLHNEIMWGRIKGFRNHLVHDYGDVDFQFVFDAIFIDIPKLKRDLEKLYEIA